MAESNELVVYGNPLQHEEDIGRRRRAKALEKGTLKRQPVWEQEVLDEEGRRRFHGAFTGGFSAGYYNTVGSKEGWEPKTFKSSRSNRADKKEHTAYDYMDADEKTEMEEKNIGTSHDFDTFGFTSAEYARRQADHESRNRPSAIPGPIPDEMVVPVAQSIGVRLLLKMGWRHGRVIGSTHIAAASDSQREGRKAMLALSSNSVVEEKPKKRVYGAELPPPPPPPPSLPGQSSPLEPDEVRIPSNTPVFVMTPKNNVHGLGFDPYKSAPEFRVAKRVRHDTETSNSNKRSSVSKPSLFRPNAGSMAKGFGIGALEDMGEEDEDVYASGPSNHSLMIEDEETEQQPQQQQHASKPKKKVSRFKHLFELQKNKDILPGFKLANDSLEQTEWYDPPVVPPEYVPVHKFANSVADERSELVAPPEVAQPEDNDVVKLIDGLAVLVARSGLQFESLSKQNHKDNPLFEFLFGGSGSDYYSRRLWEERMKYIHNNNNSSNNSRRTDLDAQQRGMLLGEFQLQRTAVPSQIAAEDRARLQENMNQTFTKSAGGNNVCDQSQPFRLDPAKQARFEQFVKDKYRGGLRKTDFGAKSLTEVQRAQELLEFESVAHSIHGAASMSGGGGGGGGGGFGGGAAAAAAAAAAADKRFTSGGYECAGLSVKNNSSSLNQTTAPTATPTTSTSTAPASPSGFPKRDESPWRPLPLLCKRFDVIDPFAGRAAPTKAKSKTDSLTLATTSENLLAAKLPESFGKVILHHNVKKQNEDEDEDEDDEEEDEATAAAEEEAQQQQQQDEEDSIEQIPEKPVDLYKAIFSDDSDDEDIGTDVGTEGGSDAAEAVAAPPERHAAEAALNRLVADDFLESLGKELGIKVPPPPPPPPPPPLLPTTRATTDGGVKEEIKSKKDEFKEFKRDDEFKDEEVKKVKEEVKEEKKRSEKRKKKSSSSKSKKEESSRDRRKRKRKEKRERRHSEKKRKTASSSSSSSPSSSG